MMPATPAEAVGLELSLVHVRPAADQRVAHGPLGVTEGLPVDRVELLDDLERPATLQHVAPDDLLAQKPGLAMMARLGERVAGLAKQGIGTADDLVEVVEPPAGALHPFERLGDLADRLDGRIVHPLRSPVRVAGWHGPRADARATPGRLGTSPTPLTGRLGRPPAGSRTTVRRVAHGSSLVTGSCYGPPMRPTDLAKLRIPAHPTVSPDGRLVVYSLGRIDLDADAYRSDLMLVPTDGSAPPRRLTHGRRDTEPRFSPDGRWLAFLRAVRAEGAPSQASDDDGKPQLHVMPVDGGEVRQVCAHPLGVAEHTWHPDSRRIAYVARVPEAGRYGTDPDVPPGKEPARRITTRKRRLDGVGWTVDRRPHVSVIDALEDDTEPVQVTDGDFDHAGPAWSPDGGWLAFVSARHDDRDRDLAADVHVVETAAIGAEAPRPRRVTDTTSTAMHPVFTPDGTTILFRGHGEPLDVVARNTGVFAVPWSGVDAPAPSPVRLTDEEAWEAVDQFQPGPIDLLADATSVLTTVQRRGAVELRRFPLDGSDPLGEVVIGGSRQVRGYAAGNGLVAAVIGDATSSGDVVVITDGGERRLTEHGAAVAAEVPLQPMTELTTTDDDGHPVHGWVVRPDADRHRPPWPVLLNVHGGPFTQYGWALFDEAQVYAGAGYAVVMGNPRGSSGYGQAHGRAVIGAVGDRDEADLLALLDAALADADLDENRVGVMGGSYGGLMATWLMAHHDRFRAGISERALNTFDSFKGTSDIGTRFPELVAGPDPDRQREQSPLSHAKGITDPMLLIHSEQDWRCPLEQAERLYVELLERDIEVELLVFPGEGHELSRSGLPSHRIQRFEAILDWWARHLSPSAERR
jgi:dipeptidyl aminopeptidase/acylaminoacyl peptidase